MRNARVARDFDIVRKIPRAFINSYPEEKKGSKASRVLAGASPRVVVDRGVVGFSRENICTRSGTGGRVARPVGAVETSVRVGRRTLRATEDENCGRETHKQGGFLIG